MLSKDTPESGMGVVTGAITKDNVKLVARAAQKSTNRPCTQARRILGGACNVMGHLPNTDPKSSTILMPCEVLC